MQSARLGAKTVKFWPSPVGEPSRPSRPAWSMACAKTLMPGTCMQQARSGNGGVGRVLPCPQPAQGKALQPLPRSSCAPASGPLMAGCAGVLAPRAESWVFGLSSGPGF